MPTRSRRASKINNETMAKDDEELCEEIQNSEVHSRRMSLVTGTQFSTGRYSNGRNSSAGRNSIHQSRASRNSNDDGLLTTNTRSSYGGNSIGKSSSGRQLSASQASDFPLVSDNYQMSMMTPSSYSGKEGVSDPPSSLSGRRRSLKDKYTARRGSLGNELVEVDEEQRHSTSDRTHPRHPKSPQESTNLEHDDPEICQFKTTDLKPKSKYGENHGAEPKRSSFIGFFKGLKSANASKRTSKIQEAANKRESK
jgi:hypothetical protein